MFSDQISIKDDKDEFLEGTRTARQERALRAAQENSAKKIQALVRGFLQRRRFISIIRNQLDSVIGYDRQIAAFDIKLCAASEVYPCAKRFLVFDCNGCALSRRFECLCKFILQSLATSTIKLSYVSLVLNKELAVHWIQHMKTLLIKCLFYMTHLKPENPSELRSINILLTMVVSFTSTNNWKVLSGKSGDVLRPAMTQVCNNILSDLALNGFYECMEILLLAGVVKTKPFFKNAAMTAIGSLIMRHLQITAFSESTIRSFLLHILSVPVFMYHLEVIANEMYTQYITHRISTNCLKFLHNDERLQAIAITLGGNRTLCLIANLVQLSTAEVEGIVYNTSEFASVICKLLDVRTQFMMGKKSSKSHWHPVLGSTAQPFLYNEAITFMMKQLQLLWHHKTIRLLFADLTEYAGKQSVMLAQATNEERKKSGLRKKKSEKKVPVVNINSQVLLKTCASCVMFQSAIDILVQIQGEILAGLAFNEELLRNLWRLIRYLGPNNGLKVFLDSLSAPNALSLPIYSVLTLFCKASSHLVMLLDDVELYEQQKTFTQEDLVNISDLLNQFIFKMIWQDYLDYAFAENIPLFVACHSFLMILYERDCRRPFAPPNHWLIKDIRPSQFISSIDKGNKTAQFLLHKMPHIVPHRDRVTLFRKWVIQEKEALGITESHHSTPNSTFITIYRKRILEDGYKYLSGLPVIALKGYIRVKFVNEQGLDEAGIDQDGVFKEFLEETIKRVFDPSLNLFRVTDEQKLYPSPTSSLEGNHLELFEFVGRMLGKAVYEGIVVDVPFAPFFLTQVLVNSKNSVYSCFDELASLDADLYRNLTYVKHYEGDISDLDLNFSYDEDFMGKVRNVEIKPGGQAIAVTNENKVSYVHHMAMFKMRTQIREQTAAFTRGFRSIVNIDWLTMFSSPEVQKLISGDTGAIDLQDLRKHTQYYGGFHNNHKVICWLWDILQSDFSEKERSLFLKFVTSCSKPPLLGFAQLEPAFSIRCVELSDEQDTGDTIGSVLKGFFNIRRNEPSGRLPTSSTCFNLLKLPNYSKKSVLRDKLRYSITSNTGFELS